MTDKDIDLLLEFQRCSVLHPLTCGNDSGHLELYPHLNTDTGVITLFCVNCDYTQLVNEGLMAIVRSMLPGAREVENALKAVSIMKEKVNNDE